MTASTRKLLIIVYGLCALCGSIAAQTNYFPKKLFNVNANYDKFIRDWYSAELVALQEPSLFEESHRPDTNSYRFLWLRTFNNPVSIRLDINNNSTGTITTKVAGGAGGYAPGKLIHDSTRPLAPQQIQAFLAKIGAADFWSSPTTTKVGGCDGAEWII